MLRLGESCEGKSKIRCCNTGVCVRPLKAFPCPLGKFFYTNSIDEHNSGIFVCPFVFRIALVYNCCVPYYQKLGGLKQHKFIFFQFWRSEVWDVSLGWNEGVGKAPSVGSRRNPVSLPFLASRRHSHSLACGHLPPSSKPTVEGRVLTSHQSDLLFCLLLSLVRSLVITLSSPG